MEFIKTEECGEYIVLSDAPGGTAEFEFLELFLYGGGEYAALLQRGDDMLTLLKFDESDGREHYYTIDDDAVFDKVYSAFKKEFSDEYDFI